MNVDAPRHRLASLFETRSVAIVGASERNQYAITAFRNLQTIHYTGRLHMVNARGGEVFGQLAVTSCMQIGERVETAYICVPLSAVFDALNDAIAAGISNFIVLTSGFAEVGGGGVALQARLAALCLQHDLRLLGPNCLGFTNYADAISLGSIPLALPQPPAFLAIISASGATSMLLSNYARQCGIGITHVIATGNEVNITTADCLDYLLDHPSVKAIAVFLESVRDPGKFAAAARRALQLQKPIVVLKVGASPVTAAVAAAHSGALVGNDKVFDAACEDLGIVRVATFEHLITTAATLATIGPLERPGVACISISGGACEVMSDLAQKAGVELPEFAPQTVAALRNIVSDLGQTHNPIDLTGAAIPDPSLWEKVTDIVSGDPRIGMVLCNFEPPDVADSRVGPMLDCIARSIRNARSKAALISSFIAPVNEHGLAYFARHGLPPAIQGLGDGMNAVGQLIWWSQRLAQARIDAPPPTLPVVPVIRPQSEQAALAYLQQAGVPVIPATLATSAEQAVQAARGIGGATVLKIASPDVAHKTEHGGVLLNLQGDSEVAAGFARIMAAVAQNLPAARLDGVAVSPMRGKGIELFVSISRDPQWGLVLALGLGGVWVELLQDTNLCILPVTRARVIAALEGLRGAAVFKGYRGARPADLEAVATVIEKIADAALALGPELAVLEINPLRVDGAEVEALDALVTWSALE